MALLCCAHTLNSGIAVAPQVSPHLDHHQKCGSGGQCVFKAERGGIPMSRIRTFLYSIAGLLVIAAASATVRADTITVAGVSSGQVSTALVVCEFNSQTNTFTFTITNTSAITTPGSTATITGIGFDLPPLGNASASGLNGFTGMQAPSLSSN